jgi:DNA polymerase III delta subunit
VPSSLSKRSSGVDPFQTLEPLLSALKQAPLPPVLFVFGDDEWIVGEACRRLSAAFRETFTESEVAAYEAGGDGVREALNDTATIALFATNRLVLLSASDLLRARKLTAEEIEARRSIPDEEGETAETALGRLEDYLKRATASDNVLLVHAVSPDPAHRATQLLARSARVADLTTVSDGERRERLAALGLERALERHVLVEPEVFETLTERGRLSARAFLQELDRLIETAPSAKVTGEQAARLVVDERKEYGSDFVEAVAKRQPLHALRILERLLGGSEFTAFRPSPGKDEAPVKKGPRGEAAFFPLLGLLAAEIRRMLTLKAATLERSGPPRRIDYRTFADRFLPSLRSPRAGLPPLPLDAHPYVLYRGYLASMDWSLPELKEALKDLEAIDRGVKTGAGTGSELMQAFLLARASPRPAASI